MADYKRLVSYIYAYSNGQKDKNVGFAKVEIKNGQCKIYISLKGVYTKSPENYGVFFAVRKDEKLLGAKIGDIAVKNGVGEYTSTTYPGNIHNSGYSFSDINGLFIGSKNNRNNVLASQWDDQEINTSNIIFPDENSITGDKKDEKKIGSRLEQAAEKVVEKIQESLIGKETEQGDMSLAANTVVESAADSMSEELEVEDSKKDVQENIQRNVQESIVEQVEDIQTSETENMMQSKEATVSQNEELSNIKTVDTKVDEKSSDSTPISQSAPILNTVKPLNQQQEAQQANVVPIQYDWKTIFQKNRVIDAFSDDDFFECIEISPEDLKKMPLSDPNLCSNSFLMHGYYGYKHILFGKVQRNGEDNLYFIGIPGVYSNREKFMSSMFGFNNFKKSHRGDYRNPYFGYWYIELYI